MIMRLASPPLTSTLTCLTRAGKVLKVSQSLKNPVVDLQEVVPVAAPINVALELKEERLQIRKCLATRMSLSVVATVFPHLLDLLQLVLERLQVLHGALWVHRVGDSMPVKVPTPVVEILVIKILAWGSKPFEVPVWQPLVICESLSRYRKMRSLTLKLKKAGSH